MEKLHKKKTVAEIDPDEFIDDIFFVKYKKSFFGSSFQIALSDSSGKLLDFSISKDRKDLREFYDSIKTGCVVRVKGRAMRSENRIQLIGDEIEVLKEGEYHEGSFMKPPRKDVDLMYKKILDSIDEIDDETLRGMVQSIFNEEGERFKVWPAAMEIHHNWRGGLMEHTMEVLECCRTSKNIYETLDTDLLIAGALLHDVGKLSELTSGIRTKFTDEGQFLGHIVLGLLYVSRKCDEFEIDEKKKNKLLHMVASHHGRSTYGSPREPMFPEAFVLYYADEFSSKVSRIVDFVGNSKTSSGDFAYSRRDERGIYLR